MKWFRDWIIRRAMKTPYRKGHIFHKDGTLYMGRYSLFETKWLSARVHHIATHDTDMAMHDHPWNFVSCVLRGHYHEDRPLHIEPCFYWNIPDVEMSYSVYRPTWSWAYRRATDRHRISFVASDTWTLFIYGHIVQWWGFYTPTGKIYWEDYVGQSESRG